MIRGASKAERKWAEETKRRLWNIFDYFFVRFLWTNRSDCFTLNWMSGPSGISPVDQILRNVDLAGIQDERARECIRLLLNLIESLTADLSYALEYIEKSKRLDT